MAVGRVNFWSGRSAGGLIVVVDIWEQGRSGALAVGGRGGTERGFFALFAHVAGIISKLIGVAIITLQEICFVDLVFAVGQGSIALGLDFGLALPKPLTLGEIVTSLSVFLPGSCECCCLWPLTMRLSQIYEMSTKI